MSSSSSKRRKLEMNENCEKETKRQCQKAKEPGIVIKSEHFEGNLPMPSFEDVAFSCYEVLNDGFTSEGSDDLMGDWGCGPCDAVEHRECPQVRSENIDAAFCDCQQCGRSEHAFASFGNNHFCFECGLE